jgi:hypothetical protein
VNIEKEDNMDWFEIVSTLVLIITVGVMIWQNFISRAATQSANTMELINFLQEDDTRQARKTVITTLKGKPLEYILESPEKHRAASKVCSTYDVAGILLGEKFARTEIFLDNWGPSISDCYEILSEFIMFMQDENRMGKKYWDDFQWLYNQVVKYQKISRV